MVMKCYYSVLSFILGTNGGGGFTLVIQNIYFELRTKKSTNLFTTFKIYMYIAYVIFVCIEDFVWAIGAESRYLPT